MENLIGKVPKAELHVHIEGTMEPELLFALSQKNNIPLSQTLDQCKQSRLVYEHLQDFLNQYYLACNVLKSEDDFYRLAMEYFDKAIKSNILYCEVFFDPQTHLANGISFETVIKGLTRASEEVKNQLQAKWIMCFLRHLPESEGIELINQAVPFAHLIHGIGLDSAEEGNPPGKYENAFRIAAEKGLCGPQCLYKTAHAGEECDASSIISTLYHLNVPRIDHGVRSIDCDNLCKALVECHIALTLCPLSNVKLRVKERFFPEKKAIKELFDAGVMITINSDDPGFFGGYINENYAYALMEFEEERQKEVLRQLAKNGFLASFISEEEKNAFCVKVDEVLDRL